MQKIQQKLHTWYQENKRDLPWRHTIDAYHIWISEIILQQTQVAQGLPYYLRFIEYFPTVEALADAVEDEVLKLWQGLGYYSRARNMHYAAKQVIASFNGVFPTKYEDLITLKGVGDYTAAAVSSFSSGESKACVDGNVIRVICRLFGINIPYDTGEGKKSISSVANELLDKNNSSAHNQAIMEFGALQCTPQNPNCENCPLQSQCVAFSQNTVQDLPVKSKKTKVQNVYLYYFVIQHQNTIILQQRTNSGIWKNMYEFPLLESNKKRSKQEVLFHINKTFPDLSGADICFSKNYAHILSHRKISALFIHINTPNPLPLLPKTLSISIDNFDNYPVSRLIERFWEDFS